MYRDAKKVASSPSRVPDDILSVTRHSPRTFRFLSRTVCAYMVCSSRTVRPDISSMPYRARLPRHICIIVRKKFNSTPRVPLSYINIMLPFPSAFSLSLSFAKSAVQYVTRRGCIIQERSIHARLLAYTLFRKSYGKTFHSENTKRDSKYAFPKIPQVADASSARKLSS